MDESPADCDLDIIGVLEGTDKSSSVNSAWDYLRHYQALFAPWQHQPINVIEIGVDRGASLNVWRKYFSVARIIGIDINPDCRAFAGDRVVIEIGSQEDPGFLHRVCSKYPPSIIIDDGSHFAHHVVWSFRYLFPILQDGGLYIVEDLAFHFGKREQGAEERTVSAPDYFLGLARQRMANNFHLCEMWGEDQFIRDHLDAITFIGSALAVRKRKTRDTASALAFADEHLRSIGRTPAQLLRIAEYVLRHGGSVDHAERMVQDAVRLGGPSPEAHRLWVDILCRLGRLEEAAVVSAEATRRWPGDHSVWHWHSLAEQRLGHVNYAIAAIERAIATYPNEALYHDRLSQLLQQLGEPERALMAAKKAALLLPDFEPLQRRVDALERLMAAAQTA